MSSSFFTRSSLPATVFLLSLPVAWVSACKGSSSSGAASVGPEPAACPAPPAADDDGGVAPYEGFASGSTTGASVSASVCNAEVLLSDFNGASSSLLLSVDSTSAFASTTVRLPAGALAGTLTGSIGVGTPTAGVYASSDAQACGSLTFSYGTVDAGAGNCDVGPSSACPPGCASIFFCPDAAAIPCCVPLATTYVYQAVAASTCYGGGTQTALGSWKLTLTSVTPYADDASAEYGQSFYLAHGTLTATLQGTTDTTDTASLSLTF
jgi:hypothetical protein